MQVTLVPRFLPLFPTARRLLSIAACPIAYRTTPSSIGATPPTPTASVCYIIGGLYGNKHALDEIERMAALETTPPTLIFNGDFNFFNVDSKEFTAFNERILNPQHLHTTGNIEYVQERSGHVPLTSSSCTHFRLVPFSATLASRLFTHTRAKTRLSNTLPPVLFKVLGQRGIYICGAYLLTLALLPSQVRNL